MQLIIALKLLNFNFHMHVNSKYYKNFLLMVSLSRKHHYLHCLNLIRLIYCLHFCLNSAILVYHSCIPMYSLQLITVVLTVNKLSGYYDN